MDAICRNCGERADGNYCPGCGQSTRQRRGPLFALIGELASEGLALDGRLVRTAGLLWRPGRLTLRHIEGKMASLVSPVRVYLATSLLFFLLVGLPVPDAADYNVYVDEVLVERVEPHPELPNLQLGLSRSGQLSELVAPLLEPKIDKLRTMSAQDLLEGFFGGLERNASTALIFFVPILALALKLLYLRRPFFYVDHLVFALHFQSVLFLLLVLASFANQLGLRHVVSPLLTYVGCLFVIMPIYLFFAMRHVYGQSWTWTLIKCACVGVLYLLLIQPVVMITMVVVITSM